MAVSITAKTAPTGKKVGDVIKLTDLFTFVDSTYADFGGSVAPVNGVVFANDSVTLKQAGGVAVTLTNQADNKIKATVTINVGQGDSSMIIETNVNKGGVVSFCAVCTGGYDGKWNVTASPNKVDWIDITQFKDKTTSMMGLLSNIMPYYKLEATAGTTGKCEFYVFGPGLESIE